MVMVIDIDKSIDDWMENKISDMTIADNNRPLLTAKICQ